MSEKLIDSNFYFKSIQASVKRNRIYYSKHAILKMDEREIEMQEIKESIETAEIVEGYPEDKPSPSMLILGKTKLDRFLHCVVAYDEKYSQTILITVYEPSLAEWEEDFKTRRRRQNVK